jgi:uncharacterized protein YciI
MRKLNIVLLSLIITASATAQTKTEKPKPVYDAALAKKLGADDYGMKKYVIAFLRKGPNRSQDSATAAQLQAAHMANIGRMAEAGQLAVAGPFMDDGEIRGIYIFNVETLEEAKKLTETDPAVKAGRLMMELHPWYGSAAMMQVSETHKRIQKKNF